MPADVTAWIHANRSSLPKPGQVIQGTLLMAGGIEHTLQVWRDAADVSTIRRFANGRLQHLGNITVMTGEELQAWIHLIVTRETKEG